MSVFFQNLLNAFRWIQKFRDRKVMIHRIDQKGNVFAHINIDVIFF